MKVAIKKLPLICLLFVITLFSCEDMLEEVHPTKITAQQSNFSEEGVLGKLYALYSKKRSLYEDNGGANKRLAEFMTSTDLAMGAGFNVGDYGNYVSPMEYKSSRWGLNYLIIDRVNDMVNNVDLSNKEKQNEYLAEARLFRAEAYFELYRIWNNIPLKTVETTIDNVNSYVYTPADKGELFNYIHADLDFAMQYLQMNVDVGRFSKAVALYLKSKVYMWQADDEDTRTEILTEENALDSAFLYTQKLILENGGVYKLKENLEDVFTTDDLNHEEMLFVVQFDSDYGQASGSDPQNFGGKYHRMPLLFTTLYKNSPLNQSIAQEYGGYGWARVIGNSYFESLFEPNDQRMQHYYINKYYYNSSENLPQGKKLGDLIEKEDFPTKNPDEMTRFVGMGCKKYWDPGKEAATTKSHRDIVVYRLAESYLIGAEVALRSGDLGSALYLFNIIHTRAGLDPVTELDMDDIMDERARELGFEGHRWFFLKRIGKLHSQVTQFHGEDTYDNDGRSMEPHMIHRAIPYDDLNAMGNYPQNDGY